MKGKRKSKWLTVAVCCLLGIGILTGCGEKKNPLQKIKDLEFTVVAEENVPEELLKVIREKKEAGIKMTYQDGGFLYICMGYGKQESGGFCITVNELYETENALYFDTTLVGPQPGELDEKRKSPSTPYVVVKTEFIDKPVVFE